MVRGSWRLLCVRQFSSSGSFPPVSVASGVAFSSSNGSWPFPSSCPPGWLLLSGTSNQANFTVGFQYNLGSREKPPPAFSWHKVTGSLEAVQNSLALLGLEGAGGLALSTKRCGRALRSGRGHRMGWRAPAWREKSGYFNLFSVETARYVDALTAHDFKSSHT